MKQELKIRIHGVEKLELKLKTLGARMVGESSFTDTYFMAPHGQVIKLVEDKTGASVVEFRENKGKFDLAGKRPVVNAVEAKMELKTLYGLKRILRGTRREYIFYKLQITFNLIEDVGDFLIVTGESGQEDFITNTLGITIPEFITVPFSEL